MNAVLDGELVALDAEGRRDFRSICECLLQRQFHLTLTYMVFDVLSVDGQSVAGEPYAKRRRILERMNLNASQWRTPETFDDGEALWEAVCEHELEGAIAKKRSGPLHVGGAWLGQDEEPRLLALGARARGSAQVMATAAVRLAHCEGAAPGLARRRTTFV